MHIILNTIEDTKKLALTLSKELANGGILLLDGDLGAGKTTFTKFLLKELGVKEIVSSPTFVIMNQYKTDKGLQVNHIDAYRLDNDSEIDMYVESFEDSLTIIEWYQNLGINFEKYNPITMSIKSINDGENREVNIVGREL